MEIRQMKKIKLLSLLLTLVMCVSFIRPAAASDEPELTIRLSRDFGYSSGIGSPVAEIQGTFSIRAVGPDNLTKVIFYLGDEILGEDSEAPFRIQFLTDNYPLGSQTMYAVGFTEDGRELRSNEIVRVFVDPSTGWQAGLRIIIPMILIIFGSMGLAALISGLAGRKRTKYLPPGTEQSYGMSGGAICPRCKRPFPLKVFSINLGPFHRLDRCDHCGKWGAMRRRSIEELRAAEAAELEADKEAGIGVELSEEEKLLRELDRSRYQDL
jgi:hypothetical protein